MTKFYDKIAKNYHSFMSDKSNFFNEYVEKPASVTKLKSISLDRKKVLDLGCGSGRYTKILFDMGSDVIGVDPSRELIYIAKKELPNIDFRIGSAEKIPCKNNEFDLVFAGMVIQYFSNPEKAFKEVSRILKSKGRFVFTGHIPYVAVAVPVKIEGKKYYEFDNYFKEGIRKRRSKSFNIDMPYYHFRFETIINSILSSGFSIIDYQDLKPLKEDKKIDEGDYYEVINKSKFYLMELIKN